MRVLHTADWHLGRTLEGRSRLEEQAAFLDELVDMVRDQQIGLILIAGDIYDSVNPPATAELLFYDAISRLSEGGVRKVIVIAGNHDNPERLAASGPLAATHGITLIGHPTPAIQIVDIPKTQERAMVYALPYPSESRLRELLTEETDEELLQAAYSKRVAHIVSQQSRHFTSETVNLLISHLYVLGGQESESERPIQVGGAYTVDTSALYSGAQYTALGHLHRPQTIKTPDKGLDNLSSSPAHGIIRYSGSPLAYSFSEAGYAKSVTTLDVKPGQTPALEEIFISSGRPLVKWQSKGGIEQVYQWMDEGRDRNAWIDLEIHMNDSLTMEQIQGLRKLHNGIIQIRPIFPETVISHDHVIHYNLPIDELFRRFYSKQTGGALPDAKTVHLFLELIQSIEPVSDEEGARLA